MSRCGKTEQLDAMVAGELAPAQSNVLVAHAAGCAVCTHELRWLQTEHTLFAQRVARAQVEQLWEATARRRSRFSRVRQGFLAAAALMLIALGLRAGNDEHISMAPLVFATAGDAMSVELSNQLATTLSSLDFERGACRDLLGENGFACGPALPASFAE
jgi:hypothetical protein